MKKSWTEQFDKHFHVLRYEQDGEQHEGFSYNHAPNSKDIKDFISDLLAQERERVRKECQQNTYLYNAKNKKIVKLKMVKKAVSGEWYSFTEPAVVSKPIKPNKPSSYMVSMCCHAPIISNCSDEGTCYYVCQKCAKACDVSTKGKAECQLKAQKTL